MDCKDLLSEHWGNSAHGGTGKTSPAPPQPSHPRRTCANATASAALMHFTAPLRSCLSPPPQQQSQNALGASRFQGLRPGGAYFHTAEAKADAATSALAQKSQEQRAGS